VLLPLKNNFAGTILMNELIKIMHAVADSLLRPLMPKRGDTGRQSACQVARTK